MRKILITIIFGLFIAISFSRADNVNLKNCKPQKFVVSGYYSPEK